MHFHVSASVNRTSIEKFGLDWTRMADAPGIAGSSSPEVEGCYLASAEWEADWFIQMNNTGGPVDLWQVDGIEASDLIDSGSGHVYLPMVIPPGQIRLLRGDIPPGTS